MFHEYGVKLPLSCVFMIKVVELKKLKIYQVSLRYSLQKYGGLKSCFSWIVCYSSLPELKTKG